MWRCTRHCISPYFNFTFSPETDKANAIAHEVETRSTNARHDTRTIWIESVVRVRLCVRRCELGCRWWNKTVSIKKSNKHSFALECRVLRCHYVRAISWMTQATFVVVVIVIVAAVVEWKYVLGALWINHVRTYGMTCISTCPFVFACLLSRKRMPHERISQSLCATFSIIETRWTRLLTNRKTASSAFQFQSPAEYEWLNELFTGDTSAQRPHTNTHKTHSCSGQRIKWCLHWDDCYRIIIPSFGIENYTLLHSKTQPFADKFHEGRKEKKLFMEFKNK